MSPLALNVFMSGDVKLARQLLAEKVAFRELERQASESHLARLRSGKLESIETSSPSPRRAARPQAESTRT